MTCQALYGHRKLGKSSILSARCRSKIAQTGRAAFGTEAERCYNNTLRGFKRKCIEHLPSETK